MSPDSRKILVTNALPYANGDIHIGHLLEHIQSDTWVRFQRLMGNEVYYVCADDTHGTPVMLRASEKGISPEELIGQMHAEHVRDFEAFGISYDNYHTTHSEENRILAETIYGNLKKAGLIVIRDVEQLYDPKERMYLPDRYVRGVCPRCGAKDQYGDSCESCGAVYSPAELKEAYSVVSGTTPEWRKTDHHFIKLGGQGDMLRSWITEDIPDPMGGEGAVKPRIQKEARNKLDEWFKDGLRDWDISRNGPYFGFRIPDTEDKYFYVWLDAPIGYMASFRNYCDRNGVDFDLYWKSEESELYHFIGKDILYFHALFFPAMLHNSGFRRPTQIYAHGFLMVDGEKMSKSRGTFITARSYIEQGLNPEWLRYYLACKLSDRIEDVDLSLDDFISRVNSDLVGKLANIPSRVSGFLMKHFNGELVQPKDSWIKPDAHRIASLYEARRFSEVVPEVIRLAEEVNRRYDQCKPWEIAKEGIRLSELQEICSAALGAFRQICILLKPILPQFVAEAERFMGVEPLSWDDLAVPLPAGHKVGKAPHLMKRIERRMIDALLDANRIGRPAADGDSGGDVPEQVAIDDFARIDLRIADVKEAHDVPESSKLVRLLLDVGGTERTVFAGIKRDWKPEDLVGMQVVLVNNLAPRKMKFGTSEGMVIAAESESGEIQLLIPAGRCRSGSRVS